MHSTSVLLAVAVALCYLSTASAVNCTGRATCDACVKSIECFWCPAFASQNLSSCAERAIFQLDTHCPSTYHLYPSCAISGLAVLILVAVSVGIILLMLLTVIYCCCCRSSGPSAAFRRSEEREKSARDDRTRRQEERRQERQSRIADIRNKYGLNSSEERYQKM